MPRRKYSSKKRSIKGGQTATEEGGHRPSPNTIVVQSSETPTKNDQAPISDIGTETQSPGPAKNIGQGFGSVVFVVFVSFIIIGYLCGKAQSKDYTNPQKARGILVEYLVRHSAIKVPNWQVDRSADKQVSAISLKGGVIEFSCGFARYHRDLNSGVSVSPTAYGEQESKFLQRIGRSVQTYRKPKTRFIYPHSAREQLDYLHSLFSAPFPRADLPAVEQEEADTPRKGATMTEVVGALLGGAEVYTASSTISNVTKYWRGMGKVSRWTRIRKAAQLFGAGVSGFTVGFYLGYEDSPNCGSPELSDQMNQPELWQVIGWNLSRMYDLRFKRDAVGKLITGVETLDGKAVSLRGAWLATNSVTKSAGDESNTPDLFVISSSVKDILESNTENDDPLLLLPFSGQIANLVASVGSERYRESRFFRGLTARSRELRLWKKTGFDSWEPGDPELNFPFQQLFR